MNAKKIRYNLPNLSKKHLNEEIQFFKLKEKILSQSLIIFGQKGSGKTSTCLNYALKSQFEYVFFFSCEYKEKLVLELRNFAEYLGITVENKQTDKIVSECIQILEELNTDVLLIFDNVKDHNQLNDYLKIFPINVQTLITTEQDLSHLEHTQNILRQSLLNLNDSETYIQRLLPNRLSNQQVKILLDHLSYNNGVLAFNLEKIVHYIKLNIVRSPIENILIEIQNLDVKTNTISIFIDLIQRASLLEILIAIICLDYEFISSDLLSKTFESFQPKEKLSIQAKLDKLEKVSLIEFRNKNSTTGIRVSGLVMDEVETLVKNDESLLNKLKNIYENLLKLLDKLFNNDSDSGLYYVHVVKILSLNYLVSDNDNQKLKIKTKRITFFKSSLFYKLALFDHLELFNFQKSIEYCNMGLKELKTFVNEKLDEKINLQRLISVNNRRLNRFEIAIENLKSLIELQKKLDENNQDLSDSLLEIGLCYDKLNQFENAIVYKEECCQRAQNFLNDDDDAKSKLAKYFESLSSSYEKIGDWDKSIEFDLKALEVYTQLYKNKQHLNTAKTLFNIGTCFSKKNDWLKALDYFMQSYKMRNGIYKISNLDTLKSLNGVCVAYENLGDHAKALVYADLVEQMRSDIEDGGKRESKSVSQVFVEPETELIVIENRDSEDFKAAKLTISDVSNWFIRRGIDSNIKETLSPIDGRQLKNYFLLCVENPQFFENLLINEVISQTNYVLGKNAIDNFKIALKELFLDF